MIGSVTFPDFDRHSSRGNPGKFHVSVIKAEQVAQTGNPKESFAAGRGGMYLRGYAEDVGA